MTGTVIAIDGPSGVGKSTVAREVARRLGLAYLDTGATYRAGALWCMREGIRLTEQDDVAAAVQTMNVQLVLDPDNPLVLLDGEDVSRQIRSSPVTLTVSEIATNLEARAILGQWQRDVIASELTGGFSQGAGIVAEGRDITTVIAPEAESRVLMTADPEVRVARRAAEESGGGLDTPPNVDAVRDAVLGRDAKDAKAVNVTEAASGVFTLDTTHMTIDDAVQAVIDLAHRGSL